MHKERRLEIRGFKTLELIILLKQLLRMIIKNIKLKFLYVIPLSPHKIKTKFKERRVLIPIQWPNTQLTFMFRVRNFCNWFALIYKKKMLLLKIISLDIIKLGFYGRAFTHVFWSWNYFSISHRIHAFMVIYVQKVTSINFVNIPISSITSFLKGYTIDESIFILLHPIQEEKRRIFPWYIYIYI